MRSMRFALLFSAAAVLAACSAKKDELGKSRLATVEGFCAEWAERACNETVVSRCSATDAESCREAQAAFCEGLVTDGQYSSESATRCLDAVAAAYEDAQLTPEERAVVRKLGGECDRIASGSGGEGDTCTELSDCNRDIELVCVKKGTSGTGTCQEPEEVAGGFDCSAPNAVCAQGFYCDGENCIAGKRQDAACSSSTPCQSDLRCVDASGAPLGTLAADGGEPTGTCAARRKVGEACDVDDDCSTGICTLPAGSSSGICIAETVLAPTEPTCIDLR